MKVVFGIAVLALVVGSIYADTLWKRWMAERRAERGDRRHAESGPRA